MIVLGKLLLFLLFGHFLADTALQSDYLAKAKRGLIEGCPAIFGLLVHATIHAGFVLLFTNSLLLAIFEIIAHTAIDSAKCRGRIGIKTDQLLHIGCKIVWILLWVIL